MHLTTLHYIIHDLSNILQYFPLALFLGFFNLLCLFALGYRNRLKNQGIGLFFLIVYIAMILQIAFFSRDPGSRTGVNFELFGTWGGDEQSRAYVIENIFMFIPWGFLIPLLFRKLRKGLSCIASACFASILLETVQYFTQRGYCQLDDIVMNTLGCAIGWGFFRLAEIAGRSKRHC